MQQPGDRVGAYTLVSVLGHGGFGSVWLAKRGDDATEVALKVLHRDFLQERTQERGPTVIDRFLAEARIIQRLRHPGLVEIYDVIDQRDAGVVAYAMEKLEGCDLTRVGDLLDLETLIDVIAESAETLAFVHGEGVIHRDVKPHNVFICDPKPGLPKPCRVKLLDFGTAKELYATARLDPTATNMWIGTLCAMAPESFKPKSVPTPAVDQWGFGVTLFHLLTGRPPFLDVSLAAIVRKIESEPVPPLEILPRFGAVSVKDELEAIIHRCLAKSASDRFPEMADVARELRRVLETLRSEAELEGTLHDPVLSATEPNASPASMNLAPRFKLAQAMVQRAGLRFPDKSTPVETDEGGWDTVIRDRGPEIEHEERTRGERPAHSGGAEGPDRDTDPDPIVELPLGSAVRASIDPAETDDLEKVTEPPTVDPDRTGPTRSPITVDGDELRQTIELEEVPVAPRSAVIAGASGPTDPAPPFKPPPPPVQPPRPVAPPPIVMGRPVPVEYDRGWSWGMIFGVAVLIAAIVIGALMLIPRP